MSHVLVVDDEPIVRSIIMQFLQIGNHTAVQAASGEEALGMISASEVDLVVTDLSMPGMTGLELRDRVRQTHPNVPFIVVSGHMINQDVADEFDAALEKPLCFQDLLDAVTEVTTPAHLIA